MKKYFLVITITILLLVNAFTSTSQVITSAQIDSLAELTLKTFDVPGIAVGVIKEGKLIHA
ncbi:MAG: hypothetical protein RIR31_707, partial [Bacteroidota bacterium]